MSNTASPPWSPEYERLAVHCSSCPTCTAVDEEGVNRKLRCAEGARANEAYRQARQEAGPTPSSLPGR